MHFKHASDEHSLMQDEPTPEIAARPLMPHKSKALRLKKAICSYGCGIRKARNNSVSIAA